MSHACVTQPVTSYSNLTQVITNDDRSFSHRNFKHQTAGKIQSMGEVMTTEHKFSF